MEEVICTKLDVSGYALTVNVITSTTGKSCPVAGHVVVNTIVRITLIVVTLKN